MRDGGGSSNESAVHRVSCDRLNDRILSAASF